MNRHTPFAGSVAESLPAATALPRFENLRNVMAAGWSVRNTHYALHGWYNPLHNSPGIAYGLLVPKRFAPRAVRRTLIKRQMRAVCVPALTRLAYWWQHDTGNHTRDCGTKAMAHRSNQINHCQANQFVIRFTRSYPRDVFCSAQSAPLAQHIRQDLLHLLHKTRQRFPACPPLESDLLSN